MTIFLASATNHDCDDREDHQERLQGVDPIVLAWLRTPMTDDRLFFLDDWDAYDRYLMMDEGGDDDAWQ